jgi:hypothetical protein
VWFPLPPPPMVSGLKALNFLCRLIGNQRKSFSCWRRCQRDVEAGVGGGRVPLSFLEMGEAAFRIEGSFWKGG